MNTKFLSSALSIFIVLASAACASAQNVLLFTFDDSGPNTTATVTGSFDTSGLSFSGQTSPVAPGAFPFALSTGFYLGTTTATNVDQYVGATAPGPTSNSIFLFNFFPNSVETPLSEYLEIVATFGDGFSSISLAEGETSFNADALENNVLVFGVNDFNNLSGSFLSATPTTVLSDPSGENTIQFVLAVSDVLLGDVNQDGVLNFEDIGPFIEALANGAAFSPDADIDQNGEVNFLDVFPFILILFQIVF